LKFKLELSLVNLFVSRILVTLCWLDSRTDVNPVDGINGAAFRRRFIVAFGFDFCGARGFIWWLLSDKRNSLLIASGDCVPKIKQRIFLIKFIVTYQI
jgi:hypothetical protein